MHAADRPAQRRCRAAPPGRAGRRGVRARVPSSVAEPARWLALTADSTATLERLRPRSTAHRSRPTSRPPRIGAWRKANGVKHGLVHAPALAPRGSRRSGALVRPTGRCCTPRWSARADVLATLARCRPSTGSAAPAAGRPPAPRPHSTPPSRAWRATGAVHADVDAGPVRTGSRALAGRRTRLIARSRAQRIAAGTAQWRADRLLDELTDRHVADADLAVRAFDYAWLASFLDTCRVGDPRLGGFDGTLLHTASTSSASADAGTSPARQRACGEPPPSTGRRRWTSYPEQSSSWSRRRGRRRSAGTCRCGELFAAAPRRADRAQAVLGDEPARRQPAAAAPTAVLRRRHLRRGQPGPAGRRASPRSCAAARSSSPATSTSSRRPTSSPPPTTPTTDDDDAEAYDRRLRVAARGVLAYPAAAALPARCAGTTAAATSG